MNENWCPVCNHAAHDATWECEYRTYNVAPEFGFWPQKCGCTFSLERVKRGEADAAAGRVVPLDEAMRKLKERIAGNREGER